MPVHDRLRRPAHGTILAEQYAAQGVHISATGNNGGTPDALIVFDTNLPPTHDPDLAIDIGNIALMALNLTDYQSQPTASSTTLTRTTSAAPPPSPSTTTSVSAPSSGSTRTHVVDNFVIAYNAAGDVIISVPVPLGANSSVQTIPINADGVRRLVFDYDESGGFTGIEVDCEQATPTPTAQAETPSPTPPRTLPAEPTPTPTPAPTDTPAPTPSPTAAAETSTPTPAPSAAASADTSVNQEPTEVLAAGALPAGGGTPSATEGFRWAAPLMVLALVLVGTFVSRRRPSR